MTPDHRKLRQLRHQVDQVVTVLGKGTRYLSTAAETRMAATWARDTLEIALAATAPEPDPGDAIDAEELRPGRSER